MPGCQKISRIEILTAIATAHADALIKHYGHTQAIIGLDPGHGGLDLGAAAQTADGQTILEKDINWKVAQMVAKDLDQKTAGRYKIIILRPENPIYELRENNSIIIAEAIQKRKALLLKMERELRTNPADLGKNIAYISIHSNGSKDQTQQGIETYSPNSLGMSNETHRQNSKALAQTLHQEIKTAILRSGYPVKDRGTKEDPDLKEPKGNTDPSQGPFIVLGSPKLDRDLSR